MSHRKSRGRPSGSKDFLISGDNGVRECIKSPHVSVQRLLLKSGTRAPSFCDSFRGPRAQLKKSDAGFDGLHQGIGVMVRPPQWPDFETLLDRIAQEKKGALIVMLDQVTDPNNLGQIIRTAEAAGVDMIVVPHHRSGHVTQTVAQVSQGAFAWLPVVEVVNLRQALDRLKQHGYWIYGCQMDPQACSWSSVDYHGSSALVFGSEGVGLRSLTRKTCDQLVYLPLNGHMESLNVGAAVSALVYEVIRQRSK